MSDRALPAGRLRGLVERARRLVRSNVAVYLLGTIASRIGAIVLIPLYTRRLTPADYGEYSLAVSLLQLLPMGASLGLTAGIARVYFDTEDPKEGLRAMGSVARGMMFVVALLLGLLALGVFFAPDVLLGVQRRHWFYIMVAAAGTSFGSVPDLLFRASQQPKRAVTLQLTSFFLMAGLGVFFVLGLGRGLSGALEATAIASAAIGLFGVGFVLLRLPSQDIPQETRRALGISIPLVPHYLANWLQITADRWVLTAFGASASLGAYYLATQILSPLPMLSVAWNDAEAPRFGELYRSGGPTVAYANLRKNYRNYFLVTLVPAVLALAASPLLPLLIGPKFLSALSALPLIAVAHVLDSFYYPSSNFLFYVGRTRLIPVVTVTAAVIGIGCSILLLPRFGLFGLLVSRVLASLARSVACGIAVYVARPRDAAGSESAS